MVAIRILIFKKQFMIKRRLIIYLSIILVELFILFLFITLIHNSQLKLQPLIYQDLIRIFSKGLVIIINILAVLLIGVGSMRFRIIWGLFCGLIFLLGMQLLSYLGDISLMNLFFLVLTFLLPLFILEFIIRYRIKKKPTMDNF